MRAHLLQHVAVSALVAFAAGASAAPDPVVVSISTAEVASRGSETPRLAQVRVTDIRTVAARSLERTTLGAVSMGRIDLQPPVPELVQAVVEARADEALARRGVSEPQAVGCAIRVFDIATPATLLYWDVRARVELGLRVRGQERTVSGAATERTYFWPTAEVIARVTTVALLRLGTEAGQALDELLAPPP
ncbi:MAG: hypothetical protein ACXWIQ_02005 [Caldimonas sp.]